jgi:hypothetical protein
MNAIQYNDGNARIDNHTEPYYLQISPTENTTIAQNLCPQSETRTTTNSFGIIGILQLLGLVS